MLFGGTALSGFFNRTGFFFNLHPTVVPGVLLAVVPKVPKSTLFSTPHLETEFSFCGGKRKISASDVALAKLFITFHNHTERKIR
ncbi:MAG: hypothetical protein Q4D20_10070, partial [Clostridia bacterium]|nr:hypothetical protein [Clostridia bacterium]